MRQHKIYMFIMAAAVTATMSACGGKENAAQTHTAETESKLAAAVETTTAAMQQDEMQETEEVQADTSLDDEMKTFADMVKEAVATKNMPAIEKLLCYPTYLGTDSSNNLVINNTDEFLALNPEQVFTESLMTAIAAVDTSQLEMTEAGVVMGDATPNITFNLLEGNCFGITGINE